ncbi:MAG: hypothetical protein P1U67_10950 [Alcanivoracaceae bacterium]|nr:hypothetical protein [Alcanivoracaceae bacterium]
MNAVTSPRARLVDLLWQLKQAYDHDGEQGEVRFIHFNTLLNDDIYRSEIVAKSINSRNRKIRDLGAQLHDLNRDGILLHKRSSGQPAGVPMHLNPDIAETMGRRSSFQSTAKRWPMAVASVAFAAMLAIGIFGYQFKDALHTMLDGEVRVHGSIVGNQTWTANRTWVLDGMVFVEEGSSLTIEAGTLIQGLPGSALVVTRGATLYSRGSRDKPIVFTSGQTVGTRRAGDWGGVVLLGSAPINRANASIEGIAETDPRGQFGGTDTNSSCGLIEYTRIEFAGYEISKDNELNGLTLGGCGSGTIVRNVQVHRGLDDGIEVFGGTVDMKRIVITGADDDSLDWDMGWQGRVQFLVIEQYSSVGDNAFEGDNNKKSPNALPRSHPTIYNATLVSPRSREKHHRAMTIRHDSGGDFHNFIVQGFSGESVDIGGAESAYLTSTGELSFGNMIFNDIGTRGLGWFEEENLDRDDDDGFDERLYFTAPEQKISFAVDPMLPREATNMTAPNFAPSTRSPARNNAMRPPKDEFWEESADYLGAIKPGLLNSWVDGWTAYPLN